MICLAAVVVLGLGLSEGASPCREEVHESIAGVEPLLWRTPEQVVRDTLPEQPQGSAGPVLEEGVRSLRVQVVLRDAPEFTCHREGDVVQAWDGIHTVRCNASDVLTYDKRLQLTRSVDTALTLLSALLSPNRLVGEPSLLSLPSALARCSPGGGLEPFNFPLSATEADFVLFVTPAPLPPALFSGKGVPHAVAWPCHFAAYTHRPVVGLLNYAPAWLRGDTDYSTLVVQHELVHALGWTPSLAAPEETFFTKWVLGKYARRARHSEIFAVADRPTKNAVYDFDVTGDPYVPSAVTLVISQHVLAHAREHFACPTLTGVELEDHTFSTPLPARFTTHWEKRLFSGELMTSRLDPHSVLSNLTLAFLHDTGYYTPFYNRTSQPLLYGAKAGCDLPTMSCYEWHRSSSSKVSGLSCLTTFRTGLRGCSAMRTHLAVCSGGPLASSLVPVEYIHRNSYRLDRIFSSMDDAQRYGGCDPTMDYCMTWTRPPNDQHLSCSTAASLNGQGQNCWREQCDPYSVASAQSACFVGDVHQAWVARQPDHGHCLPYECFHSQLTGGLALRIHMGQGAVECYREGPRVGPLDNGDLYWTFTPRKSSALLGSIVCPNPASICALDDVSAPFAPPIFLAPYYQEANTPVAGPSDPVPPEPAQLHVARVLVNGIDPCSFPACTVPVWPDSQIVVAIDGGPFVAEVLYGLWVGFGRDAMCRWTGTVAMDFEGVQYANQRATFRGGLPWWAMPTANASLPEPGFICIKLEGLRTVTVTNIPVIRFRPLRAGVMRSLQKVTDLLVPVKGAVPLGTPLTVALEDWPTTEQTRLFYSFAAVTGTQRILLHTVSHYNAVTTRMLPPGRVAVEGRIHLYDGTRMSDWFVAVSTEVVIEATGGSSASLDAIYSEVKGVVHDVASSPSLSSSVAVEAFGTIDNTMGVMSVLHSPSAAVTGGLASLTLSLVGHLQEVDDSVVEGAVETMTLVSHDYHLLDTSAQHTTLASAKSLLEKMEVQTTFNGTPIAAATPPRYHDLLQAVDNVGVAAEATRRGGARRVSHTLEADTGDANATFLDVTESLKATVDKTASVFIRDLRVNGSEGGSRAFTLRGFQLAVLGSGSGEVVMGNVTVNATADNGMIGVTAYDQSFYSQRLPNASLTSTVVRVAAAVGGVGVAVGFPVDLSRTRFPTEAECRCTDVDAKEGMCTPPRMTAYIPHTRRDGGNWSIAQPFVFNVTEWCWHLTAGTGSGWRASTIRRHFAHLEVQVPALQVSDLLFRSKDGTVSATNAVGYGSSPAGHGVDALLDGDPLTYYVDYNLAPVVMRFRLPPRAEEVALVTSPDSPQRDPVMWRVEGSNGGAWVQLAEVQETPPVKRGEHAGWHRLTPPSEEWYANVTQMRFTCLQIRHGTATVDVAGLREGETAVFLADIALPTTATRDHSTSKWSRLFTATSVELLVLVGVAVFIYVFLVVALHRIDRSSDAKKFEGGLGKFRRRRRVRTKVGDIMSDEEKESTDDNNGEGEVEVAKRALAVEEVLTSAEAAKRWLRGVLWEMHSHSWLSVVFRPPGSAYSRVQRVVVLFTFVFAALFSATLFFGRGSMATTQRMVLCSVFASGLMAPVTALLRNFLHRSRETARQYIPNTDDRWMGYDIQGQLAVTVIGAKDLPMVDGGASDPYHVVRFENKKYRSTTCWDTADPMWGRECTVYFPVRDETEMVNIELWDDQGLQAGQLLGYVCVPLPAVVEKFCDHDLWGTAFLPNWWRVAVPQPLVKKIPYTGSPSLHVEMEYTRYPTPVVVSSGELPEPDPRRSQFEMRQARWQEEAVNEQGGVHLPQVLCDSKVPAHSISSESPRNKRDDTLLIDGSTVSSDPPQQLGMLPGQHMSRGLSLEGVCVARDRSVPPTARATAAPPLSRGWFTVYLPSALRTHSAVALALAAVHIILYLAFPPLAGHWYIFVVSGVVHVVLAFLFPVSLSIGVQLLVVVLWVAGWIYVADRVAGAIAFVLIGGAVVAAVARRLSPHAPPACCMATAVGVQAIVLAWYEAPPVITGVSAVLSVVAGAVLLVVVDRAASRPFLSLALFFACWATTFAVVLSAFDWDGKAIASIEAVAVPCVAFAAGSALVCAAYALLRGPLLPPRVPRYMGTVGYTIAILIQLVAVLMSFVLAVDVPSDRRKLLFDSVVWTWWQDIFVNEPLRIFAVTQFVPLARAVAKGPAGRLLYDMLNAAAVQRTPSST